MGCASSTPMVATAGSEMLKAATHVAGDVKQKGEEALEGATQTLSETVDTAKETVSTAVAGITNELGNAFKEGSEALGDAKHKVMEGLHLEGTADEPSTSRAPTPALDGDADSLKTSTPEPEIERALANNLSNEEEAPPTPKPSLQELAELSSQADDAKATVANTVTEATTATATATEAADSATATSAAANVESRWYRRGVVEEEDQPRPSTTEWEKLADQLAKSRKFRPYESFAHSQNQFSVYKDYTSLRDKPGHYTGHFSDGNSLSSTSRSLSDLSSGHPTPGPPTRRGHRDYAKFVGSEQPTSVSRASSRLSNVGVSNVRTFDYNPQRERISLPIATSRVGSRVGSALNGRRSLWARSQPDVLPEEPQAYNPVKRSSISMGSDKPLWNAQKITRSTSNLTNSSLPIKFEATRKPVKPRISTADTSNRIVPAASTRRASQPIHREIKHFVSEQEYSSRTLKRSKDNLSHTEDLKVEKNEKLKSMLMDSVSGISSAVLRVTPLSATSSTPKSPSRMNVDAEKLITVTATATDTATSTTMPPTLGSRASTFIAEKSDSRSSFVKLASPNATPLQQTPVRLPTGQSVTSRTSALVNESSSSPRIQSALHSPILNTSSHMNPAHVTPRKLRSNEEQMLDKTIIKGHSPTASPACDSSRLSSASSTEIIIKPLSHLNTPSAVSLTSDQVVITEYEDADLEAALATLADWRGSTTTLHSIRSTKSHIPRTSLSSSRLDSRRTSPWINRQAADHNHNKDNRVFSSCGIAGLTSPTKRSQKQLERCDICCNEIVMN